jgi:ribosomal protein L7/L12
MKRITFKGFVYGMQKVEFTKMLRIEMGLTLSEAKHITNDITEGKIVHLDVETEVKAESLYIKATELGVVCEISDNN